MATEILATGSTAATSSEIVLGDGESATVGIKDAAFGTVLVVETEVAESPSTWEACGFVVANPNERVRVIDGAGVYRLRRAAGVTAGAFRG